MIEFLEYSLLGLLSGGVMALIALSFVLVYKGTGAVNFAVGEIMMVGAYLYYAAASTFGLPPLLAFVVSLGAIALLALVVERAVLRPLSGQPTVSVMMATIGMASIMHGGVEAIWGGDTYAPPPLLPRSPVFLGEILIPGTVLGNFAVSALLIIGFLLFFRYSKTGVALRATASDQAAAYSVGINVPKVFSLAWMLAGAIAGVAGIVVGSIGGISSAMGVFGLSVLGGEFTRTRRALAEQMLFGTLGMFLYLAGFALAIGQRVPTGLVALIADLVPLAIAALSQPVLKQRLTPRQWLGTAIGVGGVVLVSADSLSLGTAPFMAYALPVVGMLLFAVVTVLQKRLGSINMPIHQSLCIQCLTAAVFFAITAGAEGSLMPQMDGPFQFGVAWLVLFSTFFCYSVYYLSLRLYPAAQVSSAVYLSPPVTMLWAWAMFGEPLTAMMFAGLAVTLVGVWLAASPAEAETTGH